MQVISELEFDVTLRPKQSSAAVADDNLQQRDPDIASCICLRDHPAVSRSLVLFDPTPALSGNLHESAVRAMPQGTGLPYDPLCPGDLFGWLE